VVEFLGAGHVKTKSGRFRIRREQEMFTGNLIEDLIAAVDRVDAGSEDADMTEVEPWFASAQDNSNYESKLLGVA
jgi:hypothetical protein